MAENRKSFILHIDSLDIIDELTDEQAGQLFRAIKAYQKNEQIELNQIVKISFSQFRNQFVRDEEKYKQKSEQAAKAGSIGGKRTQAKSSERLKNQANQADSDSNSVSDSDSDSKNDNNNKYAAEVLENSYDVENILVSTKIKPDAELLKKFVAHLGISKKVHTEYKEFLRHFTSWIGVMVKNGELQPIKPQKEKTRADFY